MANIKGFAIRGLLRYLKEKAPHELRPILDGLPPAARASFEKPIMSSQWYPYEAFSALLRAIDRRLGKGDLSLCREIGDFAAQQDLTGMFKMLMSVLSAKLLLERSNLFWSKYCDEGKFSGIVSEGNHFVLRLDGFPGIDEAQCQVLLGFIRRWGFLARAKDVFVLHPHCTRRGADHCEWRGVWQE